MAGGAAADRQGRSATVAKPRPSNHRRYHPGVPNHVMHLLLDRREDPGRFRLRTQVAGFRHPDVECRAKADQGVAVFGPAGIRQVLDLVRVDLRVIQLLVRQARREQGERGAGQGAAIVQFSHQRQHQEALLLVSVQGQERLLGHEVADVAIVRIADRADPLDRLVDTIARAEDIPSRRVGLRARKMRLCIPGGRGKPAIASVVAVRSSRLTTALLTVPAWYCGGGGKCLGQRMMSGTWRPLS